MPTICCNGDTAGGEESLLLKEEGQMMEMTEVQISDHPSRPEDTDYPQARTLSRNVIGEKPIGKGEIEMQERRKELLDQAGRLRDRLENAESLVARIKAELAEVNLQQQSVASKLRESELKRHMHPKREGRLEWVDSNWFAAVCNLVVGLNLAFMVKHKAILSFSSSLAIGSDQVFLLWYTFELTIKIMHHRSHFFIGPIVAVWWGWLDFGIVASGIVDQWLMPVIMPGNHTGGSMLSALRLLRLFRILRFLKILKAFLVSDLSWIGESKAFDLFMSGVVGLNGVIISFELDIHWHGWVWVDNCFLLIYAFDVALRLKRWGCYFFVHPNDVYWNWLDFVVVTAGMLDSWLLPGIEIFETEMMGVNTKFDTSKLTKVMSLMKLMRLLRVLRLVRVLRSVPPLYTLLVGVIDAFKSMQWVIILTLLTLYAGAIVFTNLVGHGLIYGDLWEENDEIRAAAQEKFGYVLTSLFSLFELMNGDTSVIEPIKSLLVGRLLFAGFMVVSNWAILAILTAVVSENMMSASNKFLEEEDKRKEDEMEKKNHDRLKDIFRENDSNQNGDISKAEWSAMLNDKAILTELSEDTHLDQADLADLFDCLCVAGEDYSGDTVRYEELIDSLKVNAETADKRAVMHVMLRLRIMQDQFKAGFEEIKGMIDEK